MVLQFYNIIFEGIEQFVPKAVVKIDKFSKWYSSDLMKLNKHKNKLHKRYKKSGLQRHYDLYSDVRKEVICYQY